MAFGFFKRKDKQEEQGKRNTLADADGRYSAENCQAKHEQGGCFSGEPRDSFKPKAYYLKELKRADDFLVELEKATQAEDDGQKRYCRTADQYLFRRACLLYMLRADAQEIADAALRYVKNVHERVRFNDELTYNIVCRALAFSVLFDFEPAEIEFLATPLKLQGLPEDAVSDLLRHAIFCDQARTDKDFYYKDKGYFGDGQKDRGGLMRAINAPTQNERNAQFAKFLESVKEKHYQRLLKHYGEVGEERYTYTGSFDFRLTALAKALGIPKDTLADSKFIAADLL